MAAWSLRSFRGSLQHLHGRSEGAVGLPVDGDDGVASAPDAALEEGRSLGLRQDDVGTLDEGGDPLRGERGELDLLAVADEGEPVLGVADIDEDEGGVGDAGGETTSRRRRRRSFLLPSDSASSCPSSSVSIWLVWKTQVWIFPGSMVSFSARAAYPWASALTW